VIHVLLSFPAGSLIDRFDKRKVLGAAMALSAIPIMLYPFSGGFLGALAVFVPLSVANAFMVPAAAALMADLCPPERRGMVMANLGRGMVWVNYRGGVGGGPGMGFVLTLPAIVGAYLGGYIYESYGAAPWLLMGGALALNAVLALFLLKTRKKKVE